MRKTSKVLLIEGCNFTDFPAGGQLSFARQMMAAFGNRLALVGISTDGTPVGKWVKREIDGIEYDYFAVAQRKISAQKPLIPARISGYLAIRKYKKQILSKKIKYAFVQAPQTLVAVHKWGLESICYHFPGVGNPLSISRYPWAKHFSGVFDKWFLPKLTMANIILAAADEKAIGSLIVRSKGHLAKNQIVHFPTRVDTTVFYPDKKTEIRKKLKLPENTTVLVTTGRIHWAKGWQLILNAFELFNKKQPDSLLYFVGDGEDRHALEQEIANKKLKDKVILTGFQNSSRVADYLRAADVFVLGSEQEGWSTSLVEALATCLPIVSTDVSSADTIIRNGYNGFVVKDRNAVQFANKLEDALGLNNKNVRDYSISEIEKYSLANLASDLGQIWEPLAE